MTPPERTKVRAELASEQRQDHTANEEAAFEHIGFADNKAEWHAGTLDAVTPARQASRLGQQLQHPLAIAARNIAIKPSPPARVARATLRHVT